ncbi:MAG: hypothetical protein JJU36_15905 [Phycisphaeraceae bacterium]|nr:hypothetical protein [Phycisphaeraceae bacterium]
MIQKERRVWNNKNVTLVTTLLFWLGAMVMFSAGCCQAQKVDPSDFLGQGEVAPFQWRPRIVYLDPQLMDSAPPEVVALFDRLTVIDRRISTGDFRREVIGRRGVTEMPEVGVITLGGSTTLHEVSGNWRMSVSDKWRSQPVGPGSFVVSNVSLIGPGSQRLACFCFEQGPNELHAD